MIVREIFRGYARLARITTWITGNYVTLIEPLYAAPKSTKDGYILEIPNINTIGSKARHSVN
jgi:hypothetical protein